MAFIVNINIPDEIEARVLEAFGQGDPGSRVPAAAADVQAKFEQLIEETVGNWEATVRDNEVAARHAAERIAVTHPPVNLGLS